MIPTNESYELKEVKSLIKALIISNKGGMPINKIDDEYHCQTGDFIPYLRLGFTSLYDMLRNFNGIRTERNELGDVVYRVVDLGRMAHIDDLVRKQKDEVIRPDRKRKDRLTRLNNNQPQPPKKAKNTHPAFNNFISGNYYSLFIFEYFKGEDSAYESTAYDDDNQSPIRIEDPPRDLLHVHEPLMNGQQLIGDDFFLQLAIRNLRRPIWRKAPCTALHCGLCISGMTIRALTNKIRRIKSMSNKIIILIGAEDVYKGHSFDEMKWDFDDMIDLLHVRFAFSRDAIKLCTIPPLANLGVYSNGNKLEALRCFNNYLRCFASSNNYGLVDFSTHMTNPNLDTEWDLFQLDARMVSGSSHPYVLWNKRGRCLAVNLLARPAEPINNDNDNYNNCNKYNDCDNYNNWDNYNNCDNYNNYDNYNNLNYCY
ncbi:GSCOCG00005563001-RA-CDS [Cotesia congregata]|nr:GSCOCG00011072001-RA-CDS [Cotesia congregata]CAD6224808.1 GSCOCG00005563001-RA-CDS [Cotesia congregata]